MKHQLTTNVQRVVRRMTTSDNEWKRMILFPLNPKVQCVPLKMQNTLWKIYGLQINIAFKILNCWIFNLNYINFVKFSGKHWSCRSATLLKRDSNTDVLPWILLNFWEQLFSSKQLNVCFWSKYGIFKTSPNVIVYFLWKHIQKASYDCVF